MRMIFIFTLFFVTMHRSFAENVVGPVNDNLVQPADAFYDPTFDYSYFLGRVTDKDATGKIFKIESESRNTRLFRVGDKVEFLVNYAVVDERCTANVRSTENGYFTIYVNDLWACWKKPEYFRRGTILRFYSSVLGERVKYASAHRVTLMHRKTDLFRQLNQVNHFLWSFDQQRVSVAADYDQEILRLQQKKQEALDAMLVKKEDQLKIQQQLMVTLDQLEKDLDFYRVDRKDQNIDRWYADRELGLPVGKRPQPLIMDPSDSYVEAVEDYRKSKH